MTYNSAIFYDIENVGGASLQAILAKLKKTSPVGQPAVQRAYAHWEHQPDKTTREVLTLGIDPVEIGTHQKNAADIRLAADAMELLNYLPLIHVFVIVSGDGGFVQLARKLHEYGKFVVGCGREECTGTTLKEVCDLFVIIPDPDKCEVNGPSPLAPSVAELPAPHIESQAGVSVSDQDENGRRYPDFLKDSPDLVKRMGQSGLAIGLVADQLRKFKDRNAGKHRWLIKLLLAMCKDTAVCVANAPATGECRIFARGSVPPEYEVAQGN